MITDYYYSNGKYSIVVHGIKHSFNSWAAAKFAIDTGDFRPPPIISGQSDYVLFDERGQIICMTDEWTTAKSMANRGYKLQHENIVILRSDR